MFISTLKSFLCFDRYAIITNFTHELVLFYSLIIWSVLDTRMGNTEPADPLVKSNSTASEKAEKPGGDKPYIVFVGQLDYATTAEEVEKHFRLAGGVEGPLQVL